MPSSGGGAPGIPPKYATALQIWSTTVMGFILLSSVKRRACSNFVSSGAKGLARCFWSIEGAKGDPTLTAGELSASSPLRLGGTYFSCCAALARDAVFSLVLLAAASRSAAASLPASFLFPAFVPICITLKFPFLMSVFPFSLLGTGFLTLPSLLGRRTLSSRGLEVSSPSSGVPNRIVDGVPCFPPEPEGVVDGRLIA